MDKGSSTNRKRTIVVVTISYIIYMLSANFIFNRMIKVEGESKLQNIQLEARTNDILFSIDEIKETKKQWKELIQISGWGFIRNKNTNHSKIYIVLRSNDNVYVFDTSLVVRWDINKSFSNLNLDLNYSGFLALIPKDLLKDGCYHVGIYIVNENIEAFTYTNNYFTKNRNDFYNRFISKLEQMQLPNKIGHMVSNLEKVQKLTDGGNEFIEIEGWAFGEAQNTDNQQVYVVLKSDNDTYIYDTVSRKRPDVTNCYKRLKLNLDNSGFLAAIPKDELKRGKYEIGIYIKKDDVELLQYSGKTVTI